ncbi:hypothetical protein [Thermosulfurimonas dismutans]|uniref:Uncharacterized protein n=1 Tax=Thermosulfurimonas dismutans TaxID=999894 RepID=A0A179D651_9BACT|nr:hypothetical protein [Thermosulfurimonas dismutans]OAQ21088.1 hypothetical protein TDIS_0740 [Thermosulfurimonas dismutans]
MAKFNIALEGGYPRKHKRYVRQHIMKTLVYFPQNPSLEAVLAFCDNLFSIPRNHKVVIDFAQMGRIEPFSMIYVAKIIRDYSKFNDHRCIWCKNHQNKNYAAHMGFFKAFYLDHGKKPGEAFGSSTYLPVTSWKLSDIEKEAKDNLAPVQQIIESKSEELAIRLTQQKYGNLAETITYSLREILRNILEHSDSPDLWYCAQYWPQYHKAEIAILDSGKGIKKALSSNPYLKIESHSDAIQQALLPGISGKVFKGRRINRNDPWHNSGFGLYMTSRLCRNGGEFFICSGDHGILLNENGKKHFQLRHFFSGTAVKMVLSTDKLGKLAEMLSTYRNEGFKIAKKIKGICFISASMASLMLSKDFKVST